MNGFYCLIIYYDLIILFVTREVSGSAVKINNLNDAGNPVLKGSLCIIENSAGALYLVFEKEKSRRKEQGHIGIVGGRAEEVGSPKRLEMPLETMIRETFQEVSFVDTDKLTLPTLLTLPALLHEIGVVTLYDVGKKYPSAEVTLYSLLADFSPVENEEVSGVVYSKQTIIDILQEEIGYLKFRPVVLEALACHFGIDLTNEQKSIGIRDQNYAEKPTAVIDALISVLSTGK